MNKKKQLANKKHRKSRLRVKNLLNESLKLARPKKIIAQKETSTDILEIGEVKKAVPTKKVADKPSSTKKTPAKKVTATKKTPAKKSAAKKSKAKK